MWISELNPDTLTRDQITKLIFSDIHDDEADGDCIFVFGGKSTNRVLKAAKLYKEKRAPFILLTGGNSRWEKSETEAEWMRDQLLAFDIPKENMLLELQAANTTENVIGSMMVLQKEFSLHRLTRLLIVSSPYHMRRCEMTLKTYMPDWISYSLCPDDRPYGQSYNWWKAEKERQQILKEVRSIVNYTKAGILKDQVINID